LGKIGYEPVSVARDLGGVQEGGRNENEEVVAQDLRQLLPVLELVEAAGMLLRVE
jgi:hypothetical protein